MTNLIHLIKTWPFKEIEIRRDYVVIENRLHYTDLYRFNPLQRDEFITVIEQELGPWEMLGRTSSIGYTVFVDHYGIIKPPL